MGIDATVVVGVIIGAGLVLHALYKLHTLTNKNINDVRETTEALERVSAHLDNPE